MHRGSARRVRTVRGCGPRCHLPWWGDPRPGVVLRAGVRVRPVPCREAMRGIQQRHPIRIGTLSPGCRLVAQASAGSARGGAAAGIRRRATEFDTHGRVVRPGAAKCVAFWARRCERRCRRRRRGVPGEPDLDGKTRAPRAASSRSRRGIAEGPSGPGRRFRSQAGKGRRCRASTRTRTRMRMRMRMPTQVPMQFRTASSLHVYVEAA